MRVYNNVAVIGAHNASLTAWSPLYLNTDNTLGTYGNVIIGGNVGIGTTTPNARLSIGNNVADGFLDNYSEYQQILYDGGTAVNSYGFGIKPYYMVFNTNGGYSFDYRGTATRMVIDLAGNVGIGTTNPGNWYGQPVKLDVASGYAAIGGLRIGGKTSAEGYCRSECNLSR